MNRYEDLRAPVLARLGSDGGKSVSRFLGRLPVEQIRPEISRLNSNLTLHHSAPRIFTAASGLPHPLTRSPAEKSSIGSNARKRHDRGVTPYSWRLSRLSEQKPQNEHELSSITQVHESVQKIISFREYR